MLQLKLTGDKRFWWWYLAIVIISLLVTSSSTTQLSILHRGNSIYFWFRHLKFVLFGASIVYLFSILRREYINIFYTSADIALMLAAFLVLLTSVRGVEQAEAKRWFEVFGVRFQPSEIAKFALIVFAAKHLTIATKNKNESQKHFDLLFWSTIALAAVIGYYNLSSAIIIVTVISLMVAVSEIDMELKLKGLKRLAILGGIFIFLLIAIPKSSNLARFSTWKSRFEQLFNPSVDITSQSTQAKVAIAKGGLFKLRPGKSEQKYVIPQAFSDYLFSIIVEEFGCVGGCVIILAYIYLLGLIAKLVYKLKRVFLSYMVIGFGFSIATQAFVHILVNVGLLPVTGQPLPFMSLGGTSVLVNSAMIGLIIAASRYVTEKINPQSSDPVDYTFEKQKIIIG